MQRAPWAWSSSTGRWTRNSLKSPTRSAASRYWTPTRSIFTNAPSSPTELLLTHREALAVAGDRALHMAVAGFVAVGLLGRPLREHALVVAREDLDEAGPQRVEVVEHALAERRAGAADVLGDQVVDLHRVGVVELL